MRGILLIDKEQNMTSHDIVADLRRHLGIRRIGHAGTLDPFATGVMVLLIDEATKLSKYLMEHDKVYDATFVLGESTETLDATGKEHVFQPTNLEIHEIESALDEMLGPSLQLPPAYSAIKVQGQKMVDLARKNKDLPELERRPITIYERGPIQDFVSQGGKVTFRVRLSVSKGTYIRAIARDLGLKLNTIGMLSALRRLQVGKFTLEEAVCLESIHTGNYRFLDPIDYLEMPRKVVSDEMATMISYGRELPVDDFDELCDTILMNSLSIPIAIYRYDEVKNTMRMSVLLR